MRKIWIITLLVGALSGCSAISYLQTNPEVVTLTAKHTVYRYIAGGSDPGLRAGQVIDIVTEAEKHLEGNPTATPMSLVAVASAAIDWDSLAPGDRFLIEDLLGLVETRLAQEASQVPSDAVVRMRVLLRTVKDTARMF